MKTCKKCGISKLDADFYHGRAVCKDCCKSSRKAPKKLPVYQQTVSRDIARYGVVRADLLADQGGVCAGCGRPPVTPRVLLDFQGRGFAIVCSCCYRLLERVPGAQFARKLADLLDKGGRL